MPPSRCTRTLFYEVQSTSGFALRTVRTRTIRLGDYPQCSVRSAPCELVWAGLVDGAASGLVHLFIGFPFDLASERGLVRYRLGRSGRRRYASCARADYSQIVSIRQTPEYQAPELLEKAWSLPVARLYRNHVDYQRNASFCGPASLVNVLRSQGRPGNQDAILQGTHVWTVVGMLPGGLTLR